MVIILKVKQHSIISELYSEVPVQYPRKLICNKTELGQDAVCVIEYDENMYEYSIWQEVPGYSKCALVQNPLILTGVITFSRDDSRPQSAGSELWTSLLKKWMGSWLCMRPSNVMQESLRESPQAARIWRASSFSEKSVWQHHHDHKLHSLKRWYGSRKSLENIFMNEISEQWKCQQPDINYLKEPVLYDELGKSARVLLYTMGQSIDIQSSIITVPKTFPLFLRVILI